MEYNVNIDERTITITKDGQTITLTGQELRDINREYDINTYYREDVDNAIEVKVENNELPINAMENEEFAKAVLIRYAAYREDNCDDSDDAWTWQECMDEAFNDEIENFYPDNEEQRHVF